MNTPYDLKLIGRNFILTCCVISGAGLSHAADYYRWVGSDGVVHYGATPPQGIEAERIKTFGGKSTSTATPSPTTGNSQSAGSPAGNDGKTQLTEQQIEAKKSRCTQEQSRLATLNKPGRIRMTAADGSVKYLSEDEIAREIETTKKVIEDSCN